MRATPDTRLDEFHYDFVDPGSYVASHMIDRAGAEGAFAWRGIELRPPPLPMLDPHAAAWRARHAEAAPFAQSLGLQLPEPDFLPWTRKAHELCELARDRDRFHAVRRALFSAHFVDRLDLGRIDLLTEIAHAAGLDRTETRAALDVNRYQDAVVRTREAALERGVGIVPTVATAAGRLEDTGALREIQRLLKGGAAGEH